MTEIHPAIRAEFDQTPEWWDQQYRALERKQIPRDPAYHEGHNLIEICTLTSGIVRRECADCGVSIDPYTQGGTE